MSTEPKIHPGEVRPLLQRATRLLTRASFWGPIRESNEGQVDPRMPLGGASQLPRLGEDHRFPRNVVHHEYGNHVRPRVLSDRRRSRTCR